LRSRRNFSEKLLELLASISRRVGLALPVRLVRTHFHLGHVCPWSRPRKTGYIRPVARMPRTDEPSGVAELDASPASASREEGTGRRGNRVAPDSLYQPFSSSTNRTTGTRQSSFNLSAPRRGVLAFLHSLSRLAGLVRSFLRHHCLVRSLLATLPVCPLTAPLVFPGTFRPHI
jgi:hypothetical protein